MQHTKLFLLIVISLAAATIANGRQRSTDRDSLVRLIEAKSAQLRDTNGVAYRKIMGPARFLHNNTYLLCDSAIWEVAKNVIHALGNVQIVQENTFLTSDKIDYFVDEDLAQFRGSLVELYDKDGNILRTNHLDYNTKDSIATYYNGGSMRGNDGNLVESLNGKYVSAEKTFYFFDQVEMFTDSVFIKADELHYNTESNRVYFGAGTIAWQDENIFTTEYGYLDRPTDIFNFSKESHILTAEQELWADTLIYDRGSGIARLYSNIQMLDSVQSALAFADFAEYLPQEQSIVLSDMPSVALYTFENEIRDTIFFSADTIFYYTKPLCDVDSATVAMAKERKKLADTDPVNDIEARNAAYFERMKNKSNMVGVSAEEAAASIAAYEETQSMRGRRGDNITTTAPDKSKSEVSAPSIDSIEVAKPDSLVNTAPDSLTTTVPDSLTLATGADSLTIAPASDSLTIATTSDSLTIAPADSLATIAEPVVERDSTSIAFIDAWHNVKLFRADFQAVCDSLIYTGIDSIARLYKEPILWNDTVNQITSDSIQVMFRNNSIYKANMISNAFISAEQDTLHYNQVKGTEMIAFFDHEGEIYRFDAIGGASMIFFLREKDSLITTMNRKEGRIISSRIKDRQIQRIKYIEELKNDAFPTYNLPREDKFLRGFVWYPDKRPQSREEVCTRYVRASQREEKSAVTLPRYEISRTYFKEESETINNYREALFGSR